MTSRTCPCLCHRGEPGTHTGWACFCGGTGTVEADSSDSRSHEKLETDKESLTHVDNSPSTDHFRQVTNKVEASTAEKPAHIKKSVCNCEIGEDHYRSAEGSLSTCICGHDKSKHNGGYCRVDGFCTCEEFTSQPPASDMETAIEDILESATDYNSNLDFTQGHALEAKNRALALIDQISQRRETAARDSERNRIFSIMRGLGVKFDGKEVMRIHKEWERARLAKLRKGTENPAL